MISAIYIRWDFVERPWLALQYVSCFTMYQLDSSSCVIRVQRLVISRNCCSGLLLAMLVYAFILQLRSELSCKQVAAETLLRPLPSFITCPWWKCLTRFLFNPPKKAICIPSSCMAISVTGLWPREVGNT